jgi:hypothetical protein
MRDFWQNVHLKGREEFWRMTLRKIAERYVMRIRSGWKDCFSQFSWTKFYIQYENIPFKLCNFLVCGFTTLLAYPSLLCAYVNVI